MAPAKWLWPAAGLLFLLGHQATAWDSAMAMGVAVELAVRQGPPRPGFRPPFTPPVSRPGTVTTTTVVVDASGTAATSTRSSPADTLAPDPTSTGTPDSPMTSDLPSQPTASAANENTPSSSGLTSNRTFVITLSAVLSSVGVLLIAGAVLCCRRYRRKRRLFKRGITPIDDEEIETWKVSREERDDEKRGSFAKETGAGLQITTASSTVPPVPVGGVSSPSRHAKGPSTGSAKKAPSAVIVYQTPNPPRPSEDLSPRSLASSSAGLAGGRYGRISLDKDLPQTPIQARAPNARAGLTDETIPGDEPYLPTPKRHPSRISKLPPTTPPRTAHTRARGSRGSLRSFAGDQSNPHSPYYYGGGGGGDVNRSTAYGPYGSQHQLHRASSDYPRGSNAAHSYGRSRSQSQVSPHAGKHGRVYSTASIPPRLSLSDDYAPPRRPSLQGDIGVAIG